jgi:hypothetical protein
MHVGLILLVGVALLVLTFAFALWKGGLAERIGATMNMVAGLIVMFLDQILAPDLQPIVMLVIDGALAASFLFLAIRWASLWLGAAMLLQAVQFSLHAYYMVAELQPDVWFARISNADTTGINLVIIGAVVVAIRKRVRERREAERKAAAAAALLEPSAAS